MGCGGGGVGEHALRVRCGSRRLGAFAHGAGAGAGRGRIAVDGMAVIADGVAAVSKGGGKGAGGRHIAALRHLSGHPDVVFNPRPDVGVDALGCGGIGNETQAQRCAGRVRRAGAGSTAGDAENAIVFPRGAEQPQNLQNVGGSDEAVSVGIGVVRPLGLGDRGQHQKRHEGAAFGTDEVDAVHTEKITGCGDCSEAGMKGPPPMMGRGPWSIGGSGGHSVTRNCFTMVTSLDIMRTW